MGNFSVRKWLAVPQEDWHDMQIQKKRKHAQLASLVASIAAAMFANSVNAGGFEPIQRLGRHCGFGWGDGYHACKDSGFRPGADLPPRSYHKQFFNARAFGASCAPGSACAATSFYDQFDAAANLRPRGYGAGGYGVGGCDSGSCDSSGWAAADYSRSRTYVVADSHSRHSHCDSASCDDPSCDGLGCDRGAVSDTTAPHHNAAGQAWVPTDTSPPSHSSVMSTAPTQPSYAAPGVTAPPTAATPTAAAPPAEITSSQIAPSPSAASAASSATARSNEDADDVVVSPSDRKLVLPEQGFSEDEPTALESNEPLPAPVDRPSVESIPAPQPDAAPNSDALPQRIENPPIPETLGPLDAKIEPNENLPEGWTEKPVSRNPFIEQESTRRVKMPATLDLIPEAAGDEDDDLLLFESAQVNPPPARVAEAIPPSRNSISTYPDWALPAPADLQVPAELSQPASLGLNGPDSPTLKRPTRIPSSLFITQPE